MKFFIGLLLFISLSSQAQTYKAKYISHIEAKNNIALSNILKDVTFETTLFYNSKYYIIKRKEKNGNQIVDFSGKNILYFMDIKKRAFFILDKSSLKVKKAYFIPSKHVEISKIYRNGNVAHLISYGNETNQLNFYTTPDIPKGANPLIDQIFFTNKNIPDEGCYKVEAIDNEHQTKTSTKFLSSVKTTFDFKKYLNIIRKSNVKPNEDYPVFSE